MIYFIQSVDGGPIKIGTSVRLSQRLKQLASIHQCQLRVLAVIDGGYIQERALHRLFRHHRVAKDSEWFRPGSDLLGVISSEGREWDGSDEQEAKRRISVSEIHRQYGLRPGTAMGSLIAKNVARLGYADVVPKSAMISQAIKVRTGKTMSRQRISALTNAVRVEAATIELIAKGLGVKPEELLRDD